MIISEYWVGKIGKKTTVAQFKTLYRELPEKTRVNYQPRSN
jgi:hypothetical protein